MNEFLTWLAGLSQEEIPPGDDLRFEFLSLPEGRLGLVALIGVALTLVVTYLIYRRDAKRLSRGRRTVLFALRVLAIGVVAFVLLEPSLVKVSRSVRPGEVILLVDASQSMGHRDSYRRSEELADAWKRLGVEDPGDTARMDLAKQLLAQPGLMEALAEKNRVRAYLFGSAIRPAPVVEEKKPEPGEAEAEGEAAAASRQSELPPAPKFELQKFVPTEGSTNLTAAVRQALEASRDARIASVVLLTDGRRNAGGSLDEVGKYLERRKVESLLVVPIGDPAETWSVGVRDITAAERTFKKDPLKVSAALFSQGYDTQALETRLELVDKEGQVLRELARKTVDLGGDVGALEVEFPPVLLEKEGSFTLRVALDPPDGEALDEERHYAQHQVEVLGESMRVLLLAGGPSHEYRTLRTQLMRDQTIDVACWLLSADIDFPQDGNTPITELPTEASKVDEFDVVILMDVLHEPDKILVPSEFVSELTKGVVERGMGLWWVMGEKSSARAGEAGAPFLPLVELMPIVPDWSDPHRELGYGRYFKPLYAQTLSKIGRTHRICRILEDETLNATLWEKLPGFHWSFPVARAKPAAQVLVEHPDENLRMASGPRPLLATQFVGAGRVLWSGIDEYYRWRSVAEEAYNRFWIKGLRYLYEGRLAGGSSRYQLGLSIEKLTLGKELEIYLRARNERLEPLIADEVPITAKAPSGDLREVLLQPQGQGTGRYTINFRPDELGRWELMVGSSDDATPGEAAKATFVVERSELESRGPMALADLERLAQSFGGQALLPDQLAERAGMVQSRSTTEVFLQSFPLWDKWVTLGLLLFFLSIEWLLRKRWDLL
jgi:hypothetical protein